MIRLTTPEGTTTFVAAKNIIRITEAGVSSQWHGIKSIIKCSDGKTIEAKETSDHIAEQIAQENRGAK